ncbi:MAG: TonB-dependent receptor plug domain-containing protein [Bacteroidota bacterium]
MKNKLGITLLLFVLLAACAPLQNQSNTQDGEVAGSNYTLTLNDRLRNLAGVLVQGSGAGATVRIRGNNSVLASTEPLFVINGQPFNGDFAALHSFIDVGSIKKMRVVKDSGDLAMYGVQGASGVIEITYE